MHGLIYPCEGNFFYAPLRKDTKNYNLKFIQYSLSKRHQQGCLKFFVNVRKLC
jgi:hypothetical protein